MRFLRSQGIEVDVASNEEIDRCWQVALAGVETSKFDPGFLRAEWDRVVQANGIREMAEYLQVPRSGRGRTLTRPGLSYPGLHRRASQRARTTDQEAEPTA